MQKNQNVLGPVEFDFSSQLVEGGISLGGNTWIQQWDMERWSYWHQHCNALIASTERTFQFFAEFLWIFFGKDQLVEINQNAESLNIQFHTFLKTIYFPLKAGKMK